MRRGLALSVVIFALAALSSSQMVKDADHIVPNGKGWGVEAPAGSAPASVHPKTVTTGNGIDYHGGPVMPNTPNVYTIWYGNWTNGPNASDSGTTVSLVTTFMQGLGNTGYEKINSTYGDNNNNVTGNIAYAGSTNDNYSQGTKLSDKKVLAIVSNAISSGALPKDTNGLYFVLTSSDVSETSGFCTRYCGWHTHNTIAGSDLKYAFVGNPDRCPRACEAQTTSPNGDSGADGMVSIIAHEQEEAISDPDLNAWYDSSGAENADKCAWKWGAVTGTVGNGGYNETIGGLKWLIQMNWENARGGGCDNSLGGTFYTQ